MTAVHELVFPFVLSVRIFAAPLPPRKRPEVRAASGTSLT